MLINQFIREFRIIKDLPYINIEIQTQAKTSRIPWILCCDGFNFSVQAGQYMYSTPNDIDDNYSHVEVGYPSNYEEVLMPFAENRHVSSVGRDSEGKLVKGKGTLQRFLEHHGHLHRDHDWNTVYGYVPVGIVDELIKKHNGININLIKETQCQ